MERHWLTVTLTLMMVLMLGLSGCAQQETAKKSFAGSDDQAKELLIVNHTSLSGVLADYGEAAKNGVDVAAKSLGTFKVGDKKYRVKIRHMDDKGEAAESAVIARNAVDKGAVAIIGCLTSGSTAAALPIYSKANIPVISPSATRPDLTEGENKVFFRTCLRDDLPGKVLGEWAAELGLKKITVIDAKDDYSTVLGDIVEQTLKGKGVQVKREHTAEKQTDFSIQISNIKSFKSEAVIFTGYHREAGLLLKQMIEQGLGDIKFMGGDGIKSEEIFKEAGGDKNVEGAFCIFGLDRSAMEGYKSFKKAYTNVSGGKEPGPYSENAHDALGAIVAAIKKAGSTDGEKIIAALHEIKYTGIIGKFGFDKKGDINFDGGISKFEARDGKWRPVNE